MRDPTGRDLYLQIRCWQSMLIRFSFLRIHLKIVIISCDSVWRWWPDVYVFSPVGSSTFSGSNLWLIEYRIISSEFLDSIYCTRKYTLTFFGQKKFKTSLTYSCYFIFYLFLFYFLSWLRQGMSRKVKAIWGRPAFGFGKTHENSMDFMALMIGNGLGRSNVTFNAISTQWIPTFRASVTAYKKGG